MLSSTYSGKAVSVFVHVCYAYVVIGRLPHQGCHSHLYLSYSHTLSNFNFWTLYFQNTIKDYLEFTKAVIVPITGPRKSLGTSIQCYCHVFWYFRKKALIRYTALQTVANRRHRSPSSGISYEQTQSIFNTWMLFSRKYRSSPQFSLCRDLAFNCSPQYNLHFLAPYEQVGLETKCR